MATSTTLLQIISLWLVLGESEFICLYQKYIEKFSELFKIPEMFMQMNGKMLVLPVPVEEKSSIWRLL